MQSKCSLSLFGDLISSLVVNVVRMIKLFGWEKKVGENIKKKRDEEVSVFRKAQILQLLLIIIK